MTPEDFRRHGHQAIDWIADFLADPGRYPVLPPVKPGELTDALPACGPEQGEPMDAILADFERLIVPAMTQWNHPGFLAYFANSSTPEGILGELLAAALNGNGMLWKTSPAVTELEQVALRWLRQWSGLPDDWFGLIYDTASTGSMHAIAAARQAADPESRIRGTSRGLVVYTSEQAHSSIEKGAIAVGIGQDYVRKVPVDDAFRMRPDVLDSLIEADLAAGLRPAAWPQPLGPPRPQASTRYRRSRTSASAAACGCTWMLPTPERPPWSPNSAGLSKAASAPIRSSPIRTNGC